MTLSDVFRRAPALFAVTVAPIIVGHAQTFTNIWSFTSANGHGTMVPPAAPGGPWNEKMLWEFLAAPADASPA